MPQLHTLPNIGPELEKQLAQAGIKTPAQLAETGSRDAWIRLRLQDPTACLNRLCALEGAIQGIRWHNLPDETKDELRQFYLAHKA